jgi:transposase
VIAPQGPRHARELAALIEACDETIPFEVCEALAPLVVQLRNLEEAIARLDRTIVKIAQKDETARRLMTIPGFGPRGSSPITAMVWRASASGHLVDQSRRRHSVTDDDQRLAHGISWLGA